MQEKLIQRYFKPELSLELNSSLGLQTIGQNILHPKSWVDKTCIWADIVHWPAIILSSAQCTSLDMFKHFFLRLKMMMWRTWWNMQHQVNLSYSVFLGKVIFFNHKMFRKSLVSLVSFFMECWTVLCPPKPWPRLHICKTLIFKRFVKEFQLTSSVTYYWTNTQQYGI